MAHYVISMQKEKLNSTPDPNKKMANKMGNSSGQLSSLLYIRDNFHQ